MYNVSLSSSEMSWNKFYKQWNNIFGIVSAGTVRVTAILTYIFYIYINIFHFKIMCYTVCVSRSANWPHWEILIKYLVIVM